MQVMRRRQWRAVVAMCGAVALGQPAARDVRLTLHEGTSMAAALSPDGRTVASTCSARSGRSTRPAAPRAASSTTATTRTRRRGRPTARGIAFQAYHRDTWHVWPMNADGCGLRQVTSGPFDDREPHWSPDGTRLAFSSDRSGSYDMWLVTLASGERAPAHHRRRPNESMPAWSPDGREIAFVSDRQERGDLRQRTWSGAERLRGRRRRPRRSRAAWSPDGRSVGTRLGRWRRQPPDGRRHATWPSQPRTSFPFRAAVGVGRRAALHGRRRDQAPPGAPAGRRARCRSRPRSPSRGRPLRPRRRAFPPEGPQPVRGLMHPAISPDGSRGGVCRARRPVARLDACRRRGARAAHQRRVRRDQPGLVARRPQLAFSSDRDGADGPVGARHEDAAPTAGSPPAACRPRGRPTAPGSRSSITRRSCASWRWRRARSARRTTGSSSRAARAGRPTAARW